MYHELVAKSIARELGIKTVRARLRPIPTSERSAYGYYEHLTRSLRDIMMST